MKYEENPPASLLNQWDTVVVDEATMMIEDKGQEDPALRAQRDENSRRSLARLPKVTVNRSRGGEESFVVKEVLGEGGMGIVELATQSSLYRDVALKKLKVGGGNQDAQFALLREAWITGLLEHPNIIPVHGIGTDEQDAPLMVMKVVEGVSWEDCFIDPARLPGFREGRDVLELHLQVLLQVCQAIHFSHSKGIVHRDLKPGNVMIGSYGEVYVVDWGLAVTLRDDGTGRLPLACDDRRVCGTPAYLPPEMAAGEGPEVDERTDVYLLGAILHELITGEARHHGRNIKELLYTAYLSEPVEYGPEVPAELGAIANRATARKKEDRFESVQQFRIALEDYFTHRESHRLGDEGAEKLRRLENLGRHFSENFSDEQEIPAEVFALFWEGRFALEQALRIWSKNESAKQTLRRLLIAMAELQLLVGDERGVAQRLEELDQVPDYLQEGWQRLHAKRAQESEELSSLKRLKEALDLNISSDARAKLAFVVGAIFGALPLFNSAMNRLEILEFRISTFMIQWAMVLLVVGGTTFLMRETLLRNRINLTIMISAFAAILAMGLFRVLAFLMGLDVFAMIALSKGALGVSLLMMSAAIDRRFVASALILCLGALTIPFVQPWALEVDGLTNLLAFWVLALLWFGSSKKQPGLFVDQSGSRL